MIYYILGIITGLILAILIIKKEQKINHFIKKIDDMIPLQEKAEFLNIGDTEQDAMEDLYDENKKKGLDTPI